MKDLNERILELINEEDDGPSFGGDDSSSDDSRNDSSNEDSSDDSSSDEDNKDDDKSDEDKDDSDNKDKDDEEEEEEFIEISGYDKTEDSTSQKAYEGCQKMLERAKKLFKDNQIKELLRLSQEY